MTSVFADSCTGYASAGWTGVIPVPPEAKFPPPAGYTGGPGIDTDATVLEGWSQTHANSSIALRMPPGVVGIDVDHYEKNGESKRGADTLAEYEAKWGPLPATWCSTARGDENGPGPSGIRFFRAPAQRYAEGLGPDIDIIQRHHRYAVVAPSVHMSAGAQYRWYGPDGNPSDGAVPSPADLPDLPEAWVAGLAAGASAAGHSAADPTSGQALLGQIMADIERRPCTNVTQAQADTAANLHDVLPGSRHDVMKDRVYHLIQLGAEGHPGTGPILEQMRAQWDALTAGEGRDHEFQNMMATAARKAVTNVGATQMRPYDPCLGYNWEGLTGGPVASLNGHSGPNGNGPPPEQEPELPGAGGPPRIVSPRYYIGAEEFDPAGVLDHTLAEAVLKRMYPALRFAFDADTWLLRAPWAWTPAPGDLSQWAVTELTGLMPKGKSDADDSTEEGKREIARAARRARFGMSSSASAIARKMKSHVMAGTHPCSVTLADLDMEPEILWAGGIAWDLRASVRGPVQADLDPGTPHLQTAGYLPEERPTPLWDAFVRAVWPDEEVRAWALRVLAVAFTGYPDKTLPILRGNTDRGKTQLVVLLSNVLGTYAHAADTKILSGAERSHASIIMALKGRRLSFIDESPRGGYAAQERLKQLTGGAQLTGNYMNKNPVTFDPTHTLILTANEDSEPALTDAAVRRRVRLIPCTGNPAEVVAARMAIGNLMEGPGRPRRPVCWPR